MLEKRKALSKEQIENLSKQIALNFLFCFSKKMPEYTASYIAKTEDGEVSTSILNERLQKITNVCIPRTEKGTKTLTFVLLNGARIERGRFGILEPVEGKNIKLSKIGLFIIPGIAFDKSGARVGYGKGYYDHTLNKVGLSTIKVGICYSFQVSVEDIKVDRGDVRMDFVVTESGVIECSNQKNGEVRWNG